MSPPDGFLLLILSSPSGAGKTTLTRMLMERCPDLRFSVSHTTRKPRANEVDGRDYHFVDREAFLELIDRGAFLEWAEVHGNLYGTSTAEIDRARADVSCTGMIFDIDYQGARSIYAAAPGDTVRVFILPPTIAEMARRIHARAGDSDEMIRQRLETAKVEFTMWPEYDYVLLNDDFDRAYVDLAHIYHAERLRRDRNPWLGGFVQGLQREQVEG